MNLFYFKRFILLSLIMCRVLCVGGIGEWRWWYGFPLKSEVLNPPRAWVLGSCEPPNMGTSVWTQIYRIGVYTLDRMNLFQHN